jgi:hypothetical protein
MKSLADCRLYTFVDYAYLHGRTPQHVAQQLCEGGSDLIQLRAKNVPEDEIHRVAEALLSITKNAGVPLVINDYPQIAAAIGAPSARRIFSTAAIDTSVSCVPSLMLGRSVLAHMPPTKPSAPLPPALLTSPSDRSSPPGRSLLPGRSHWNTFVGPPLMSPFHGLPLAESHLRIWRK